MNSKTCVNQQALGGKVCVGKDSVGIHSIMEMKITGIIRLHN